MVMMNFLRMMPVLFFCGLLLQCFPSTGIAEDEKTAKVKIEFRLAQDLPAKGLTKATLPRNGRGQKGETIYLYPKVELSNNDIQIAAKQEAEYGGWGIKLSFTDAGGKKMYKLTKANMPLRDPNPEPLDFSNPTEPVLAKEVNPEDAKRRKSLHKRLAILIDGKLIMAPTIRAVIGKECQISGAGTEKEVDQVVDGLNKRNLKKKVLHRIEPRRRGRNPASVR